MTKIVINDCYGGFGLSLQARKLYLDLEGTEYEMKRPTNYKGDLEEREEVFVDGKFLGPYSTKFGDIDRSDPILVDVVEELGHHASHDLASLIIVEIPDDVDWCIKEYDGIEWVAEKHRTWP